MIPQAHRWSRQDFVAGELCLEFTNTVGDHSKSRDVERLTDWDALLSWAAAAGALDAKEAQELHRIARRDRSVSQQSLQSLRNFRDLLFRVLSAFAAGHEAGQQDLEAVEIVILDALRLAHLTRQNQAFNWTISTSEASIKTPLVRIALSTLRLLQGDDLPWLRECQRCSWLFVDRSKNHGRRWCRADACGNRTRVARHYRSGTL